MNDAPAAHRNGWVDRQMPAGDEVFLDHVGFFVADLEDAGSRLHHLGFTVSAINVQTNDVNGNLVPSGTSNRLVRLRRGYLEILAATHDTPLGAQLREGLGRYQGLHLIALSRDDVAGERERLVAAGFDMQPVVHLRRHDRTLPGAPEVAWTVLRPQPGVMPEGRVQFAKSLNPDRVWQSDQLIHANAAEALTDLLICVEDRRASADRYARYVRGHAAHDAMFSVVALDRGKLVFAELLVAAAVLGAAPPTLPFIAGQGLRSMNLATTRNALEARGVALAYADDDLVLTRRADSLGGALLFHRAATPSPWEALAQRRPF